MGEGSTDALTHMYLPAAEASTSRDRHKGASSSRVHRRICICVFIMCTLFYHSLCQAVYHVIYLYQRFHYCNFFVAPSIYIWT